MEIVKTYYQRHYPSREEFKSLLDLILIPEFFDMVKDSDDFSETTIDDFITICLDYIEDIIERGYYNFYTFYDLESKRKIDDKYKRNTVVTLRLSKSFFDKRYTFSL